MSDEIEIPRRGYDTKDVESLSRAVQVDQPRDGRRTLVLLVLIAAVAGALWLIAVR